MLVDNNAQGDTVFEPQEGEDSVEMDTAVVVLPPTVELGNLITGAHEAIEKADAATDRANASADKAAAAIAKNDKATADAVAKANTAGNAVKAKADADTATDRANKAAERCEGISVEFDEERGSLVIRN